MDIDKSGNYDNFRAALKVLGWSRAEFARRVQLSPRTVTRWGKRPPFWAVLYVELLAQLREMSGCN